MPVYICWVSEEQGASQHSRLAVLNMVLRADMMKNVNTVQYQELSEEAIEAARKRRSQDR